MNVALLGLGRWGKALAGAIERAGWHLVSTADPRNPAAEFCWHGHAVGSPGVEAVVIATPPDTHVDLVGYCLLQGKHVLCEKPLAFTPEECGKLGSLAASRGLTLMVDYLPLFLREIEMTAAGAWRSAETVRFERFTAVAPPVGPGPLWDLAVHDLALASHLIGPLPRDGWTRTGWGLMVRWPDGPQVSFRAGYGEARRVAWAEWPTGDKRYALQDQVEPEPLQSVLQSFRRVIGGKLMNRAGGDLSADIAAIVGV